MYIHMQVSDVDIVKGKVYNFSVADVQKTVARYLSGYSGKKLAIGVSGGRDSMCLLHSVLNCGCIDRSNITAVHINHCLRKNADDDENFVRGFCKAHGVDFRAFRVDVKAECRKTGMTVEQSARELRYAAFSELVKNGSCDLVLTAHHAADNAETVLMHIFRGSGLDGLRGMRDGVTGGYILRPLLSLYPCELDAYAAENDIQYVTDETNLLDDADRNFIRLRVMPLIEQRYRGAERAINGLAAECSVTCEYLDGSLDTSLLTSSDGAVVLNSKAFDSPLAARYVRRALGFFSTADVTREQIERVVTLAHMRTGATAELSNGIIAAREYCGVALYLQRPACDSEYPVKPGANFIDGLAVDIFPSDVSPREIRGGAVDLDKLDGAVLRFRKDGDIFTPFGGKSKKLKQYFIDSKIPKRLRGRIPLICRGSEVLVVVGMQISDEVRQTEKTVNRAAVVLRW